MYYTVIEHDGNLRTREKFRKHESQVSVFYISQVFSNNLYRVKTYRNMLKRRMKQSTEL